MRRIALIITVAVLMAATIIPFTGISAAYGQERICDETGQCTICYDNGTCSFSGPATAAFCSRWDWDYFRTSRGDWYWQWYRWCARSGYEYDGWGWA